MATQKCPCGFPLPMHLARLGLTSHTCQCERHFTVKDGKFVEAGTGVNPFARYDKAQAEEAKTKRKGRK